MNVVFRADASIQAGTGHVMRCLTLADALTAEGADCYFICRDQPGNLIGLIAERGYRVRALSWAPDHLRQSTESANELAHAHWLGTSQQTDANQCLAMIQALRPDWLIVDHYALDVYWETALRPHCGKLLVIDDLADRLHDCDILLDQTLGRSARDYAARVPARCQLLCGAAYALLRPEFARWREYSLERRKQGELRHLLINLGGVDKDNITARILLALKSSPLPPHCRMTVVMGTTAPWIEEVGQLAARMPWPTEVKIGVSNMAKLMADSDLAIGAAGSTSWERCCLGLPTIMVVLADNQLKVASELEKQGAAQRITSLDGLDTELSAFIQKHLASPETLIKLSHSSSRITAGHGLGNVIKQMSHVGSR